MSNSEPVSEAPLAAVFGCATISLGVEECAFFRDVNPLGFILFGRNIDAPDQVRRLCEQLRDSVGRADAPILIDQEGGRVQRLAPPHWRAVPSARRFADLHERNPDAAIEAARLTARLVAADLSSLGVTVNCAPVLDLPGPGDVVIGDRAYGRDADTVVALGRAVCKGLTDGGVIPVIKHLPGHGRACDDSHEALPVVTASARDLGRRDFVPFRRLADMPWAMTAHVVYDAFDGRRAATVSPRVIDEVIRRDIGFDGVLVSDDLDMKALSGTPSERAAQALAAGCDVVLHCSGDMADMESVVEGSRPLDASGLRRVRQGDERRKPGGEIDRQEALARLSQLLSEA